MEKKRGRSHTEVPVDRLSENRGEVADALTHGTREKSGCITSDYRTRYLELDALRGIAILGVVTTHASRDWKTFVGEPLNIPFLDLNLLDLTFLGIFSLTLFFLLSGYLLAWTEEQRFRTGTYNVRSYALRRVFRIVPAYYAALIIGLLFWPTDKSFMDILTHFTFTHTLVPAYPRVSFDPAFWFLTPEVLFYALLPLLILKVRSFSQRLVLLGALVAISFAMRIYMDLYTTPRDDVNMYLETFPLTYLWMFIAGVMLRMLVERIQESETSNFRPRHASVLFFSSLALFLGFTLTPLWEAPLWSISKMLLDFLVVLLFAAILLGSPFALSILRWRPIVFVGMISYSLFLLHNSVILLAKNYGIHEMIRSLAVDGSGFTVWATYAGYLGIVFAGAVAISYLSYRFIERPFLGYKPK